MVIVQEETEGEGEGEKTQEDGRWNHQRLLNTTKKRNSNSPSLSTEPPAKKHRMSDSTASSVRVAIELGYQDLMTDQVCLNSEYSANLIC